jgi:prepilin-type N-terminal cleavage/methylation domain-containing protein
MNMNIIKNQSGMTLVEMMVALALSMIVTSSMVVLMGNSLGAASRIIQMTQLSDDMRNSMSMVTRDLRRANYNANAVFCYGNADCATDGSAPQVDDITVEEDSCLTFNLDRNLDGDATDDGAGGFRRSVTPGGVGFIEMWVGDAAPDCDAVADDWIALTDPEYVDILDAVGNEFDIKETDSFEEELTNDDGARLMQVTRVVEIGYTGRLVLEPSITRRIEDRIRVRNNWVYDPDA